MSATRRAKRTIGGPVAGTTESSFVPNTSPINKLFSIDISGEPDTGKTHFARTFPNPLFLDTEAKAWIVLDKFKQDDHVWKVVEEFDDIRQGILHALEDPKIKTVVIDSGSDISQLAQREWLVEAKKDKVYPLVLWDQIYQKWDSLERKLTKAGKYLVTTSRLKDEYEDDSKTGRRIHAGYKKHPWSLSMGLRITNGIKEGRKVHFPEYVFGEVTKNNFFGKVPSTKMNYMKPYVFDVSFNGILNEMMNPWGKGVKIGEELETIIAEAQTWIET